jgi:lipoprotein NlpD
MTGMPLYQAFYSFVRQRRISYLLIGLLILSCSGYPVRGDRSRGVYHRVKSGETLAAIAKAYRVNLQELAEINNVSKSGQIETDSVLFIPAANQVVDDVLAVTDSKGVSGRTPAVSAPAADERGAKQAAVPQKEAPTKGTETAEKRKERVSAEAAAKDRAALIRAADRDAASRMASEKMERGEEGRRAEKKSPDDGNAGDIHVDKKRFIWPVMGKVVTKFGTESIMADYNGKKVETAKIMNNGIKIAAGAGTPVLAAAPGKVIYSMMLEKFGNTIIIEHDDDYKTVYYDLGKRLVETLQQVKKGDPIASIGGGNGSTGDAFMHFEIRHKNKPRNPLFFLP